MYYPNITSLYIVQLLSMPDCCPSTLTFPSSSSEGECLPDSEDFEMFLFKSLFFYFRRILIILYLCERFTVGFFSSNKQEMMRNYQLRWMIPAWECSNPVCLLHKPLLPEAAGRVTNSLEGFRYQSVS